MKLFSVTRFRIVAFVAILSLLGVMFASTASSQTDPESPDRGIGAPDDGAGPTNDTGSDSDSGGEGGGLDQQILDDLIVDGSICAGLDCVNGESFGFDTIRLKENNLRISFIDTSTSASFPSTDWQLTANESSNGGQNKFSIDDLTASRTPFTVEGGSPTHSLYIDSSGRIGLSTNSPVTDLHVVSGNTPTVRLEQDGSSGFTAQTWDLAGNEANFFVRDATNGSTLPFRIFPGAPSDALTIEGTTGDIGLGTTTPDAALDVEVNGSVATVGLFQNLNPTGVTFLDVIGDGATQLRIEGDDKRIVARNDAGNITNQIRFLQGGGVEILGPMATNVLATIDQAGNMTISGDITCLGGNGC